jgi:hypothetical protein
MKAEIGLKDTGVDLKLDQELWYDELIKAIGKTSPQGK